mmetsp:Transcript_681/g.1327  ORF Transcript_681/g.1327 Transcript_681/m.1327 type:complete len:316 (+) Transcript_681:248-1195(+)
MHALWPSASHGTRAAHGTRSSRRVARTAPRCASSLSILTQQTRASSSSMICCFGSSSACPSRLPTCGRSLGARLLNFLAGRVSTSSQAGLTRRRKMRVSLQTDCCLTHRRALRTFAMSLVGWASPTARLSLFLARTRLVAVIRCALGTMARGRATHCVSTTSTSATSSTSRGSCASGTGRSSTRTSRRRRSACFRLTWLSCRTPSSARLSRSTPLIRRHSSGTSLPPLDDLFRRAAQPKASRMRRHQSALSRASRARPRPPSVSGPCTARLSRCSASLTTPAGCASSTSMAPRRGQAVLRYIRRLSGATPTSSTT